MRSNIRLLYLILQELSKSFKLFLRLAWQSSTVIPQGNCISIHIFIRSTELSSKRSCQKGSEGIRITRNPQRLSATYANAGHVISDKNVLKHDLIYTMVSLTNGTIGQVLWYLKASWGSSGTFPSSTDRRTPPRPSCTWPHY